MSEKQTEKIRLYLWLGRINLFISAFTFGGGYVVVPMVKKYFVEKKNLFCEEELMEMAAVAQSTPGAIAINLVSLAGYRAGGFPGLLISCICAVIPPIVILSIVSLCYTLVIHNLVVLAVLKGMEAGVAALIVDFIVDMAKMIQKENSLLLDFMVVLSFVINFFFKVNAVYILIGSCFVCTLWLWKKERGNKNG